MIMVLGSGSAGLAQEPDAGDQPAQAGAPAQEAEDKYPRLVKPEGDREDNEQLGGEPSLTEAKTEPAAKVDGEEGTEGGEDPADECDLDCIEAELEKEE
ncbi:MAG: hypothetical protein JRF54_04400, partial [Deltaproteobacteria bacterium]|nr:hypothetical protein [Deltaproteobacteria bacterium]